MLEIKNLRKSFDGVQAVRDFSINILPENIISLIGPNGAGKTTVFNVLTGYLAPDAGRALYDSVDLLRLPPWKIARHGISRTFQNLRLLRKMTVLENVLLGMQGQRGEQFLNALFSFSQNSQEHRGHLQKARALVEFVGLNDHQNELADNLSYGQQKLLSIACCLATDPKVLLLDEPVAGVQSEMAHRIEALLKQLVNEQKKTVFLIEHDIEFVLRISDTVVVMDEGQKIVEDGPSAISSNPEILEAYLS